MPCKHVVGTGALLDWAVAAWREAAPALEIRPVRLDQDRLHAFDLRVLDDLANGDGTTAFAACDPQFLNFRRFELMGELKARGFSMPALVCPGAIVAATAVVGENAVIGAGAIVGHGCHVGFNAFIGAGANLGSASRIGSSAWIEAGVLVGRDVKIGANTTIGHGVIVADALTIGKLCIIDRPGKLTHGVAPRTFIHDGFDHPIIIVEQ